MARIEFNGWSAFPNPLLEDLCKDKRLPLADRVLFALVRLIVGHSYNRRGLQASLSYRRISKLTNAGRRQVAEACRTLQAEGKLIIESKGRGKCHTFKLKLGKGGSSSPDTNEELG